MVRIRAWWNSFKDIAILISFIVNFILIVVLVFVVLLIFQIKAFVSDQLINGLYKSFAGLDQAHIVTTINVSEPHLPVQLNIPLQQDTTVTLTKDVTISGARTAFTLSDGTTLRGTVSIVLPKGSALPVALDLSVPVDSSIPINLKVPVDIALDKTQLHDPFVYLRTVLRPYVRILDNLPNSWSEAAEFGGKVVAGKVTNINVETQFSQNPWPGFCTGLPAPLPGALMPTPLPDCITPTAVTPSPTFPLAAPGTASSVTLPPNNTAAPGDTTSPNTVPTQSSGSDTSTLTPTHVEDIGIITPTKAQ
jgi:hypothetical protein